MAVVADPWMGQAVGILVTCSPGCGLRGCGCASYGLPWHDSFLAPRRSPRSATARWSSRCTTISAMHRQANRQEAQCRAMTSINETLKARRPAATNARSKPHRRAADREHQHDCGPIRAHPLGSQRSRKRAHRDMRGPGGGRTAHSCSKQIASRTLTSGCPGRPAEPPRRWAAYFLADRRCAGGAVDDLIMSRGSTSGTEASSSPASTRSTRAMVRWPSSCKS